MNIAYFRYKPDEEQQIHINFHLKSEYADRVFNFSRNAMEMVETCTDRIRANVEKEFGKKNRNNKKEMKKQQLTKANEQPKTEVPAPPAVRLMWQACRQEHIFIFIFR